MDGLLLETVVSRWSLLPVFGWQQLLQGRVCRQFLQGIGWKLLLFDDGWQWLFKVYVAQL